MADYKYDSLGQIDGNYIMPSGTRDDTIATILPDPELEDDTLNCCCVTGVITMFSGWIVLVLGFLLHVPHMFLYALMGMFFLWSLGSIMGVSKYKSAKYMALANILSSLMGCSIYFALILLASIRGDDSRCL